jgi:putative tricarboxylic transport membrane protein
MKKSEILIAIILVIVNIFAVVYSLSLPQGVNDNGVIQPGVFPIFVSSILLLCSLIYLYQSIKEFKSSEENWGQFPHHFIALFKNKAFRIISSIFFYFIVVTWVGFIISTLLFFFVALHFIYKHKLISSIIIGVVFSFSTNYIFQSILGVPLPTGIFG